MPDLLSKFGSSELIGLVVIGIGAICAILGIIFAFYLQWQETRRAEIAAALKQDMLNRGMSADEIRIVLDAGQIHSQNSSCQA
jgi:hypothetical protein